uniref:Peptidase S53 domain-containing protein n=1 Tax=Coccolithus braarudii TaxID=221442 RepID=A0A7S0LM24_9EUKA|mmetsp:Transcript_4777/g.10450  ORF Transcript_4777/g.10450 Transcript_4777/m.10450 type:complete len:594 (+) Transcript_4777:51-1832(+)|eukprot:CAMPEP_0183336226 /NCGR_PEP_ID=MMETSP0164_2-20130417/4265_1 /TAXON_ID=221442 /ORGANISM="Coccolithus pelagicus ssp braarudi, Strain PLY182g" /LENGTH=593 /DNA_ID=CAMNT_0025505705 /DNA_START=51 /DNA_END=1832 /DNA_ORIENTATION=+
MKIAIAAIMAIMAVAVVASPSGRRVLYSRDSHPADWKQGERASADHPVRFIVALKQQNLNILEDAFWAVSSPDSPRYRQFLTTEEITNLVRPKPEAIAGVRTWLTQAGVKEIVDMGDALEAVTTVSVAEIALNTQFFMFHHQSGNKVVRQFGEYSVPVGLSEHIDLVAGISEFPIVRENPFKKIAAGDATAVVPQTIQNSYGTPSNHTADPQSSTGVIEFEGQSFAPSDLQNFATQTLTPIKALSSDHIVGPNSPGSAGVEATLDIQYIAAVGRGDTNWFWLEGGTAWLYGFSTHFFNAASTPLVVSISYGWSEAAQCQQGIGGAECSQLGVNSQQYVERVNTEFQKIGLKGVSLIAASGDSGANGRTDGLCTESHLNPTFPAASPYITAVGATEIHDGTPLSNPPPACSGASTCASKGTEAAVSYSQSHFASGGGFSNVASTPSYQKEAVSSYLSSGVTLPPSSYYNSTGRGYPDVAAFGSNVQIYAQGSIQGVGGTSCSAPIFGGVVGLLNDISLSKSGKPLGFLNPLLYKMHSDKPGAFTDVTIGDNHCTEEGCGFGGSCKGFKCAAGWDPVTGLGTPVYSAMAEYVSNL